MKHRINKRNNHSERKSAPARKELLMGRNALKELLTFAPERIVGVYTLAEDRLDLRGRELFAKLRQARIEVYEVEATQLVNLVGSEHHQGFVAELAQKEELSLDLWIGEISEKKEVLVLALDGIQHPQNLGAILRAAECFAVDLVLWSYNRTAPMSATVRKVSVGASELVPIVQVANLAQTLEKLKEHNFWLLGAEANAENKLPTFEFPERSVLVMGNEGEGVSDLIQKKLDGSIAIPQQGQIDSLNVSQATAVLLYAFRAKMKPNPEKPSTKN